jgi:pSer/pThr/pTyr-binding forkhead associated (FHA) protein
MDPMTEGPVLISQTGELRGQKWQLKSDDYLIGRAPDCDLVVADRQVSRHHARLTRTPDGYVVKDLGSKNGTHVNGVPVSSSELLQDGDVIQVALAIKLIFVGTEATIPLSINDATQMGLGRMRMDSDAHRVWVGGEEIEPPLSPAQYRLLDLLYKNPERVVSRGEVVRTVWEDASEVGVSEQAIDALVRRLRDRLAECDPDHGYIMTVRGHGFRLENPM